MARLLCLLCSCLLLASCFLVPGPPASRAELIAAVKQSSIPGTTSDTFRLEESIMSVHSRLGAYLARCIDIMVELRSEDAGSGGFAGAIQHRRLSFTPTLTPPRGGRFELTLRRIDTPAMHAMPAGGYFYLAADFTAVGGATRVDMYGPSIEEIPVYRSLWQHLRDRKQNCPVD